MASNSSWRSSQAKAFPYRATFDYPGLKTVTLAGQLDYQDEQTILILNDNHLTVQNLTLPLEGNISNLASCAALQLGFGRRERGCWDADADPCSVWFSASEIDISGPIGLRDRGERPGEQSDDTNPRSSSKM